jgi:hypothetical protein
LVSIFFLFKVECFWNRQTMSPCPFTDSFEKEGKSG